MFSRFNGWVCGGAMPLPRIVPVCQSFKTEEIEDVPGHVLREVGKACRAAALPKGAKVALAVGSRGIAQVGVIVRTTVDALRECGVEPFIVPAMGSHGGATAEGQASLLQEFNITKESMGVEIRSCMDVIHLGDVRPGVPVFFDRVTFENADAVIPIARIKNHTTFRGSIESGLHKMLCVGLGKHKGAQSMHNFGLEHFSSLIPESGQYILSKVSVPFGVAVIENAKETPALIEVVPGTAFAEREPELLAISRAMMPRLCFDELDALVIQEVGKNISGTGLDPNITGRYQTSYMADGPLKLKRIVALSLSEETHGNAMGMGMIDICTRRLAENIDFKATYTNAITATRLDRAKLPLVCATDREAIVLGLNSSPGSENAPKLALIKNTLELEKIYVSEALLPDVEKHPQLSVAGDLIEMSFDEAGTLML